MFGIHKIQLYIMRCLWEYDEIGFEESRPSSSVSTSLYSYHLNKLEKYGIISEEPAGRYGLTDPGRRYVAGIFAEADSKKIDIKILAHNKAGKTKIINGKPLSSDPRTQTAATRTAQEKLGCINPNLEHIGDAYIKISNREGNVLEHTLSHIFELKNAVDISNIKESLPKDVKEEILFVKNNADGHFFFERDYLID